MPLNYVVQKGDCLSSIGARFGFTPQTLWAYPDNSQLKQQRENWNILFEGDVVVIPDLRIREETCSTDALHTFNRIGVPEKLRLVILDERDVPRAGLRYVLTVDGQSVEGVTAGDGSVEEAIRPDAREGRLTIFDNSIEEDYPLELGHLDPLTEDSGISARLTNLGLDCGNTGESLAQAIMEFQQQRGLDATGEMGDATRNKLKDVYGS